MSDFIAGHEATDGQDVRRFGWGDVVLEEETARTTATTTADPYGMTTK